MKIYQVLIFDKKSGFNKHERYKFLCKKKNVWHWNWENAVRVSGSPDLKSDKLIYNSEAK